MQEEFVPYDLSSELKELGFDKECFATIDQTEYLHIKGSKSLPRGSMIYDTINCPTYSQAFKWFRDNHRCDHYIGRLPLGAIEAQKKNNCYKGKYQWMIVCDDLNPPCPIGCSGVIEIYEHAELECLKALIKIVKEKHGT